MEFDGQEMLRHIPCSGRKMLDNSNGNSILKSELSRNQSQGL